VGSLERIPCSGRSQNSWSPIPDLRVISSKKKETKKKKTVSRLSTRKGPTTGYILRHCYNTTLQKTDLVQMFQGTTRQTRNCSNSIKKQKKVKSVLKNAHWRNLDIKSAWNFTKHMHSMLECTEHHRLLDEDWPILGGGKKNSNTAIWKQCRTSMRSGGNSDGQCQNKILQFFWTTDKRSPPSKIDGKYKLILSIVTSSLMISWGHDHCLANTMRGMF